MWMGPKTETMQAVRSAEDALEDLLKEHTTAEAKLDALRIKLDWARMAEAARRQERDQTGLALQLGADTTSELEPANSAVKEAMETVWDVEQEIQAAKERIALLDVKIDRAHAAVDVARREHDAFALDEIVATAPVLTELEKKIVQFSFQGRP